MKTTQESLELYYCCSIITDLKRKIQSGNYNEMQLSEMIFLKNLVSDYLQGLEEEEKRHQWECCEE